MAVRTDYVLVTVRTPHGGRCGDPQQKKESARIRDPQLRPWNHPVCPEEQSCRNARILREGQGLSRPGLGGPSSMTKMMGFIGATAGSAVGWWAGAHVGVMTAFILSVVGTAAGVYGGKQLADHLGY